MKILAEMLRIKEFREEKAELELRRVRRALQAAQDAFERARDELKEHRAACWRKERTLYEDLCSRLVQLKDIDTVSLEVDNMKAETTGHEENVKSAEINLHAAKENLELAKEAYRIAMRMREKFSELRVVEKRDELAEQEFAESMELEEVSGNRKPRGDRELDQDSFAEEIT